MNELCESGFSLRGAVDAPPPPPPPPPSVGVAAFPVPDGVEVENYRILDGY